MLQFMGLQRVRYDLATELYWTSSGLPAYTLLQETERNFGVFCRGSLSQLNCLLSRVCVWNEYSCICVWAFLVAQTVKNPPAMQETWVWSLGWVDSPGEGNDSTPVFLPGGLKPMGCKELDMTEHLTLSPFTSVLKEELLIWGKDGTYSFGFLLVLIYFQDFFPKF